MSTTDSAGGGAGGEATVYNHNVYAAYQPSHAQLIGNVSIDPAHNHFKWTQKSGFNMGVGVKTNDNLMIGGEVGIDYGEGDDATWTSFTRWLGAEMNDNVVTNISRLNPTGRTENVGWMLEVWNCGDDCSVENNIMCNAPDYERNPDGSVNVGVTKAGVRGIRVYQNSNGVTVRGNKFYNVRGRHAGIYFHASSNHTNMLVEGNYIQHNINPEEVVYQDSPAADINYLGNRYHSIATSGNWFRYGDSRMDLATWNATTGDTGVQQPSMFPEPETRTVEDYVGTVLGESPATIDRFIELVLERSKDNWDPRLNATNINDWFRSGFEP